MKPLPFPPRPFADEALGSWVGRLAARYRVDADYELGLDLTGPLSWLSPAPMSSQSLERLGCLTRIAPAAISALAVQTVSVKARSTWYCCRCVFINPMEDESPYWKRGWLLANASSCAVHKERLVVLPAGKVRACTNMLELIRAVGKYEKSRKERGLGHGIGMN